MKTAHDILITAPETQVKRCKIAFIAICEGRWDDAALALYNAANEESGEWAMDAKKLAEYCEQHELNDKSS